MVEDIQQLLEHIYDVRSPARATDFLVNREAAAALGATGRAREELLVAEGEEPDSLELALYLHADVISALHGHADIADAMSNNLGEYCEAAEGVSHFMYVTRSAELGRKVSLFELELQAEVDKFASCLFVGIRRGLKSWTASLIHRLFDRVSFSSQLGRSERHRYEEANRVARHYCLRLAASLPHRRMHEALLDLRYSYRLGHQAKLQYFARRVKLALT